MEISESKNDSVPFVEQSLDSVKPEILSLEFFKVAYVEGVIVMSHAPIMSK